MLRCFASLATLLAILLSVSAKPAYLSVMGKKYLLKKGGKIERAKCSVCHLGTTMALNPYGRALFKAAGASKNVTPAVLSKVEKLDSDGDGKSNIAEIRADKLPGDRKSK